MLFYNLFVPVLVVSWLYSRFGGFVHVPEIVKLFLFECLMSLLIVAESKFLDCVKNEMKLSKVK